MTQWAVDVNKKVYGVSGGYVENVEVVGFDSGKKRSFNRNTAIKQKFSVMLSLNDKGTDSEFKRFDKWLKTSLGGIGETFLFPDLNGSGKDKEYRMTEFPTWQGTTRKEITMEWEEV